MKKLLLISLVVFLGRTIFAQSFEYEVDMNQCYQIMDVEEDYLQYQTFRDTEAGSPTEFTSNRGVVSLRFNKKPKVIALQNTTKYKDGIELVGIFIDSDLDEKMDIAIIALRNSDTIIYLTRSEIYHDKAGRIKYLITEYNELYELKSDSSIFFYDKDGWMHKKHEITIDLEGNKKSILYRINTGKKYITITATLKHNSSTVYFLDYFNIKSRGTILLNLSSEVNAKKKRAVNMSKIKNYIGAYWFMYPVETYSKDGNFLPHIFLYPDDCEKIIIQNNWKSVMTYENFFYIANKKGRNIAEILILNNGHIYAIMDLYPEKRLIVFASSGTYFIKSDGNIDYGINKEGVEIDYDGDWFINPTDKDIKLLIDKLKKKYEIPIREPKE